MHQCGRRTRQACLSSLWFAESWSDSHLVARPGKWTGRTTRPVHFPWLEWPDDAPAEPQHFTGELFEPGQLPPAIDSSKDVEHLSSNGRVRLEWNAFQFLSQRLGIAIHRPVYEPRFQVQVRSSVDLNMSVQYIAIIVFGGLGTTFGAIAGTIGFTFLTPLVEQLGRDLPLIGDLSSSQRSSLLFATLVCTFLVVEPLGLLGIWLRVKRYFAGWPFRY